MAAARRVRMGGGEGPGGRAGQALAAAGGGAEPSSSIPPGTAEHAGPAKPCQAPASPELPCDIFKELFAQENVSFSQSSLKAGWCPSNGLLLGLAAPARPAPSGIAMSAQCPSCRPAGSCRPHTMASRPLPEIPDENHPPRREGEGSAHSGNGMWTAGQTIGGTG